MLALSALGEPAMSFRQRELPSLDDVGNGERVLAGSPTNRAPHPRKLDLAGQRFGKLVAIRPGPTHALANGKTESTWLCRCDCGEEKVVLTRSLRERNTRSCGCLVGERLACWNRSHRGPVSPLFGRRASRGGSLTPDGYRLVSDGARMVREHRL